MNKIDGNIKARVQNPGVKKKTPAVKNEKQKEIKSLEDQVTISSKSEAAGANRGFFGKMGDKIDNWIKRNITGSSRDGGIYKNHVDYTRQHKRYAAAGAAAGGAVGCAAGMFVGYEDMKTDNPEIVWREHDIRDPRMDGFTHWVQEDGHYESDYIGTDSEGNAQYIERYVVDGYWHHYSPRINYTKVGSYSTPSYEHSSKWTPLTGGLLGLVGGTIIGGITGLVTSLIHRAIKERRK